MPVLEKWQVIMGINDSSNGFQKKVTLNESDTVHELLNTILDHLPLGVFVKDPEDHFNYLYWNKFMEEITGIDTSQIEGHDDSEVNFNALMSAEERLEVDRQVIRSGKEAEFHGWLKTVSGETKYIEVAKYPISLSNGKPLLLALWRDATVKRAIEKRLEDERDKAEMADKLKSKYLADMSHEIRTPLNAIVGFSNLMNSEEVLEPEEREQFVKLINTNSDLLLKLINDILDLSRMESGKMSFVFDRHDLNVLINEIYCTFQLMMPEGVELRMRVPEIPVIVAVDPYRLKQVLSNFINNAIKFTTSGYIEVGYYFCTKGDCLHIYVEDTGIGIPEEKQKQVFDRFCKLDEFAQGTGLGLAICQVIAQRFGGEIQLKSEYGKGSRFTLTLPKERIG